MCTWLNKFYLRKYVYYSNRNHDIVLFDYFLLLLTYWISDISQKELSLQVSKERTYALTCGS
jgi:hypothetical protein